MDSINGPAGAQLFKILERSGGLLGSKYGQKWAGMFAAPLKKKSLDELSAYRSISKDDKDKEPKSALEKVRDKVVEKFALGDLVSLAGLGIYALQSQVGPQKPGLIGGLLRNAALAMTFLGSTIAAFGRTFGYDMQYAYGDEHGAYMLQEASSRGKTIFTVYNNEPGELEKLIENVPKLRKYLVYKAGLEETIKYRHEQKSIGGLFDGPHGTGKTEGAKLAMGEKAKQIQDEGNIPVVAELNLANFSDYIDQKMSDQRDLVDVVNKFYGKESNGSFVNNQGIMVLEALISQVRDLRKQVDEYNKAHSSGPQKKLIVFVDEFDKALQTRTLKGCDKTRLRNLLIQFNEMFVKEDMLLTSNTKLEKMRQALAEHVKISNDDTGEVEVLAPMFDRLSAKNRAFVDFPAAPEQAKIIAGRVLTDYKDQIDWQDFGVEAFNSGSYEYDRDCFAEVIEKEITAKLQTKINGRQLASACDQLISMLVGRAKKINAEKKLFDDKTWEKMKGQEKIAKTGAKIDRRMLRQVVASKLQNMNLNQSQKDFDLSFKLVNQYLQNPELAKTLKKHKVKLEKNSFEALDHALALVYDVKQYKTNTVFVARNNVEFNSRQYQLRIVKYPGVDDSGPSYSIAFADVTGLDDTALANLNMHDYVSTKRMSGSIFSDDCVPIINRAAEDKFEKALGSILSSLNTADGKVTFDDQSLKAVASKITENIQKSYEQAA